MKVKISQRVFAAADKSETKVNGTLSWIMGYMSELNKNVGILRHLKEEDDQTVEVNVKDEIVNDVVAVFGSCDDRLISTLLVIAYGLGGRE